MKALKDSLTSYDGETYVVAKVAGLLIVFVFLGLAIASFITGKPFDMSAFGVGSGAVVAAMGAAIRLTESSERKPADQP